mgnify:CR=1 FL=1
MAEAADVTIRRATAADLPAVVAMVRVMSGMHVAWDAARWVPPVDIAAEYGAWLERSLAGDGLMMAVAERGGAVVGYVVAEEGEARPVVWSGRHVYVNDLYVAEGVRRSGAGAALLAAARAWAAERGTQLRALCSGANGAAQAWFTRHGFRPAAVEMVLDTPAADAPAPAPR